MFRCSPLSVIRIGPMLALVVLVEHVGFQRHRVAAERQCGFGHGGDGFERDGVVDRLGCIASPDERRMSGHEHGGHGQRIQAGKSLDDDAPRVRFVRLFHFLRA